MILKSLAKRALILGAALSFCLYTELEALSSQKIFLLTSGPIDDHSFNQTAQKGLARIAAENSQALQLASDQGRNLHDPLANVFVCETYGGDPVAIEAAVTKARANGGLIITVGFDWLIATEAAAQEESNRKILFAIVDAPSFVENVKSLSFKSDQAAFLAGYIAASMDINGDIATYGGGNFSVVTLFMDGCAHGVRYHSEEMRKERFGNREPVGIDGFHIQSQTGDYLDSGFHDPSTGYLKGINLLKNHRIILPAAGETGLGTAEAILKYTANHQNKPAYVIGVDSDWRFTTPYASIVLTSILKNSGVGIEFSVLQMLNSHYDGTFVPEDWNRVFLGDLSNGGVDIGTINPIIDSPSLKAKLAILRTGIINETIVTAGRN